MAQANDQEVQQQLAQVLQETLISSLAAEDERVAKARVESSNIEVGTGSRLVTTFGRTKAVVKDGVITVTTPEAAPDHNLNVAKLTQDAVSGRPSFDISAEFNKVRSITDLDEKEAAAQLLFTNLGQQAAVAQDRIRSLAAQKAGVNDAKAAVDKWTALEIAGLQTGKLRTGDHYIQTEEARKLWKETLQTANQLEVDSIKSDPTLRSIEDHRALLTREFTQIDKRQDRGDRLTEQFGVMTDPKINNARLALGITETNTNKILPGIYTELKKNKALHAVLDAGKADMPRLLVDQDINVRRYAYNIMAGMERENLGLSPDAKLPAYVTALEPLIANRDALISKERIGSFSAQSRAIFAEENKKQPTIVGDKAKTESKTNMLFRILQSEIEDTGRKKYQDVDKWTFTDPQFRKVIDAVKIEGKDKTGRVLMSDGVTALMKAELKNQDGTPMTPQGKIAVLMSSLSVSMENDKASFILPSVDNYLVPFSAEVRNEAMRAYVRSTLGAGRFAGPLAFIPDERIGEQLLSERENLDLESGLRWDSPSSAPASTPKSTTKQNTTTSGPGSTIGTRRG